MSNVAEIVRDALLHLGVIDAYEAPEAEQMAAGIRALNLMMRRWEADGVSLGWTDVANTNDPMPVPPEAEEAIGYNLAVRLRSRFKVPVESIQDVIALAQQGYGKLQDDITATTYERTDQELPQGNNQRWLGTLNAFMRGC